VRRLVTSFAVAFATGACASARQLVAANGDLADYRAFRVAAAEGVRLARAQRYLEAHSRGAWAEEVRGVFEAEEPAFFERASATREGTSEYLADLPKGPHAAAALVLLENFDTKVEDVETARLTREARRTEAMLDRAAQQRKALGEAIVGAVGALLDEGVYHTPADDMPAPLKHVLGGAAEATWGRLPTRREQDFFFSIPTRLERESRMATLTVAIALEGGFVMEGRVEGRDLFVHWAEADMVRLLDPTEKRDRAVAREHAVEVLLGALEGRLPLAECAATAPALIARRCPTGWIAVVTMGASAGDFDAIVIQGPTK
jgi:hypothetical protein